MQNNYNTDFDRLVDSAAQYLISRSIHPNYLMIRAIFKQDNVKTLQCYSDTYGENGFQKRYLGG